MNWLPALAVTLLSAAALTAGADTGRKPAAPAVRAAPAPSVSTRSVPARSSVPTRSITVPPVPPLPPIAAGQGVLLLANRDGSCPSEAPVKLSVRGMYYPQTSSSYRWVRAMFCFTSPGAARASGYQPAR